MSTPSVSIVESAATRGFQGSRDLYFAWLLACTAIVAIGVLIEESEAIAGWRWVRRIVPIRMLVKQRLKKWAKGISRAGWVLIIIGVVGEGVCEGLVSSADRWLQEFSNISLGSAQQEAVYAVERGRELSVSLEDAKQESHIALEKGRQRTARYRSENIGAQHQLADKLAATTESAAKAAADLEAEKKKRVELAASLLPRDFFDQSGAIAKLSGLPPMNVIFEYPDEREPRNMAQEINFVFDVLHWNTFRRRVPEELISEGIHVSVGRRPVPSSVLELHPEPFAEQMAKGQMAAKALCDGLRQSNIDVETEPLGLSEIMGLMATEDVAADTLVVMVGPKRNRVLEETLKELGPVHATTVGHLTAASNRTSIREEAAGPTKPK